MKAKDKKEGIEQMHGIIGILGHCLTNNSYTRDEKTRKFWVRSLQRRLNRLKKAWGYVDEGYYNDF